MTTKYSLTSPSPLIWSWGSGYYDEMLASIPGIEYTPDMTYYKIGGGIYLICGYYMTPQWQLYPVFAPGEVLSYSDAVTYGKYFNRSTFYQACWAYSDRSAYKMIEVQNFAYMNWHAAMVPGSTYSLQPVLPEMIVSDLHSQSHGRIKYYAIPTEITDYTPLAGVQVPLYGYASELGTSPMRPVFTQEFNTLPLAIKQAYVAQRPDGFAYYGKILNSKALIIEKQLVNLY